MSVRRNGFGLFLRYALISVVPVIVLGLGVEAYNRFQARQIVAEQAQRQAASLADGGIAPLLAMGAFHDDILSDAARAALAESGAGLARSGTITELRLWSTRGHLLIDTLDPARRDGQVAMNDALFAAAAGQITVRRGPPEQTVTVPAGGDPASTAPNLVPGDTVPGDTVPGDTVPVPGATASSMATTGAARNGGDDVTVFVPVRSPGSETVSAVAEFVMPSDQAGFYDAQRRLRTVLMAAVVVLWLVLALLTRSVTGTLRRSDREHRHMALFDQLTGLPNRRYFTDQAAQTLAALAPQGEPTAVVLLDLVGFTQINKAVGRAHGDALLRHVSEQLYAIMQPGQVIARLGGDVFALLLPGMDSAGAVELLPVVRGVLGTEVEVAGIPVSFEAAIGVASWPADGEDVSTVLQRADIAMEASKCAHVDAKVFSREMDQTDASRLGLAVELRRAIAKGELFLVYQPKVHLHDHTMRSVEALVRWNHPERGLVSPAEFIPVAEATGLIVPLTAWVLDSAMEQTARWAVGGLALRVAVNVSAKNLRDERFPEQVIRCLDRHRLPAPYIELEITETAIISDPERVARTVRRLREAGLAVALDDFGQGATSLAHLRNLPLTTLKIDKCFVDDLCTDAMDAAIVYSMIGLGHQLGLEVVAEGVETADQYATLAAWGCDVAQGFYFERPLTADHISARFGQGSGAGPAPAPSPTAPPSPVSSQGTGVDLRLGGTSWASPSGRA